MMSERAIWHVSGQHTGTHHTQSTLRRTSPTHPQTLFTTTPMIPPFYLLILILLTTHNNIVQEHLELGVKNRKLNSSLLHHSLTPTSTQVLSNSLDLNQLCQYTTNSYNTKQYFRPTRFYGVELWGTAKSSYIRLRVRRIVNLPNYPIVLSIMITILQSN